MTKKKKHETVLEEAHRLIYGARANDYGPAEKSFDAIARMWSALLEPRYPQIVLTASDVARMMAALKIRRDAVRSQRDNVTDACGYLALLARIDGHDPLPDLP